MTLSDEIVNVDECDCYNGSEWIRVDDVEKFIKELKESFVENTTEHPEWNNLYCRKINKLAGKRLVGSCYLKYKSVQKESSK